MNYSILKFHFLILALCNCVAQEKVWGFSDYPVVCGTLAVSVLEKRKCRFASGR